MAVVGFDRNDFVLLELFIVLLGAALGRRFVLTLSQLVSEVFLVLFASVVGEFIKVVRVLEIVLV